MLDSIATIAGGILGIILAVVTIVGLWAAYTAVIALVFMWGWNVLAPTVFGAPNIDFVQAFAGIVVVSIIGRLLLPRRSAK